jgi:hypothetical protein
VDLRAGLDIDEDQPHLHVLDRQLEHGNRAAVGRPGRSNQRIKD